MQVVMTAWHLVREMLNAVGDDSLTGDGGGGGDSLAFGERNLKCRW